MSDFEIQGLTELTHDLEQAAAMAQPISRQVVEASSKRLAEVWRSNAKLTSGKHGKWYPSSITSEMVLQFGAAAAEIGPDNGRRQGKMGRGFEYGSANQPPHLDGQKAVEQVEPTFLSALAYGIGGLL